MNDPSVTPRPAEPEAVPRPESETLSRLLPQPMAPVPDASFNDRFLLLLAGTVCAESVLTYRHYRLAQEACRLFFGEQALHAKLQATLHYALLHPPTIRDTVRLARHMADQATAEQISSTTVSTLLQALRHVTPGMQPEGHSNSHSPKASPISATQNLAAQTLLRDIEAAFTPESASEWSDTSGFDVEARLSDLCRRAARQLGLLSDKDTPPKITPPDPELTRAGLEQPVSALETMAAVLDDAVFAKELTAFRKLVRSQPCRMVVTGEGKRGKSTVINALLGLNITPIKESTAQTGAVLHLQCSNEPGYRVHFHDAAHLERLERAVQTDPENLLLARDLERIRRGLADGRFVPGATHTLENRDELAAFLSADGPFSGLVRLVEADLTESVLGENVVLADTPALNHFNPFLAEQAVGEALEADCVIFIMDARAPGSGSELALLRRLARSGRSVCVVGVLTHADLLRDADSASMAREQARAVLREACRVSRHVRLGGVVLVNARQAALERCGQAVLEQTSSRPAPSGRCGEFATLFTLLREALDVDADKSGHRGKVAENFHLLTRTARTGLRRHMEESLSRMPGPELLAMLEAHASQLQEATRLSLEQARQVVHTTLDDLDAWERNTERGLTRFSETLVLRLMEAVNTKVTAQGRNFAKSSVWTSFDNVEAQTIARGAVDEFLAEQRETLAMWEAKLRLFSCRMDECARICLAGTGSLHGLDAENVMAPETERATHFLVQTHHYMKNIAVFATGAAIGRATFLSPLAVVISAGNMLALAIASPMIAALVAAVAGTAGLVYHLGREDKRRAAFLDRRRKEAEAYADRVTSALREELRKARTAVTSLYELEVQKGFNPALDSLFYQSAHLRLFLDTMHTIRADVVRYEVEAQSNLKTLGEALSRKGIDL